METFILRTFPIEKKGERLTERNKENNKIVLLIY